MVNVKQVNYKSGQTSQDAGRVEKNWSISCNEKENRKKKGWGGGGTRDLNVWPGGGWRRG